MDCHTYDQRKRVPSETAKLYGHILQQRFQCLSRRHVNIGVARGCSGCTCTPRAVRKFFRPNLQEKCVSAPSQDTKCTPSQTVFAEWLRFGGIFRRSVRATTKKGRQLFGKKVNPPDKILATPMHVNTSDGYHTDRQR